MFLKSLPAYFRVDCSCEEFIWTPVVDGKLELELSLPAASIQADARCCECSVHPKRRCHSNHRDPQCLQELHIITTMKSKSHSGSEPQTSLAYQRLTHTAYPSHRITILAADFYFLLAVHRKIFAGVPPSTSHLQCCNGCVEDYRAKETTRDTAVLTAKR